METDNTFLAEDLICQEFTDHGKRVVFALTAVRR